MDSVAHRRASTAMVSNWERLQKKEKLGKQKKRVTSANPVTDAARTRKIRTPLSKLVEQQKLRQKEEATVRFKNNQAKLESTGLITLDADKSNGKGNISVKKQEIGKYLAIDCEFVGVGPGGEQSELARVSIVNFHGHTVYDEFVKPRERVTDWRTFVSGIRPSDMHKAIPFKKAQEDVAKLLKDRILVGHAVHHDLEALYLTHPKRDIRDTSKHLPFKQKYSKGKTPSLKKLALEILGLDIQSGEHSSVEDAKATMLIFKSDKKEFEYRMRN